MKELTGKSLELDFGPTSKCAGEGVSLLLRKVKKAKTSVLMPIFRGWGYLKPQINANTSSQKDLLKKLAEMFSIDVNFDLMEIIFTIHTYLATLIKLVASEIVLSLKSQSSGKLLSNISCLSSKEFKSYFILLESGDIFQELAIENFMDDVKSFSWYLHFWDEPLEKWLRSCAMMLADYAVNLESQKRKVEDLFRNLYQKLLIPALRRELGEVFTPTWLAEFIVEDIGYTGDFEKSILDPACGSGTFLLEVIRKARKWAQSKDLKPNVLAFQRNIIGFDLNPIAILAARTNYLWAIADLLPFNVPFTIPIFLADSIDVTNKVFNEPVAKFGGYFDFIIGNPPWINWEYLPKPSKDNFMNLWGNYGLFPSKGWKSKLGFAKYDISAVFVYVCMDYYLKEGGKLEFLVTLALVRGVPGRGFRRFEIKQDSREKRDIKLGLKEVHDLTQFQPFEDISTQTAIVKLVRNEMTSYPVPYSVWEKIKHISPNMRWGEVDDALKRHVKTMSPIKKDDPLSRPLIGDSKAQLQVLREKIFTPSVYEAKEGANTEGLNCAFWIQQLEGSDEGSIHFQQVLKGMKKKILAKNPVDIEPDLIFPLIRSGDLKRWHYKPRTFIIFTPKYNKLIVNEVSFQTKYPKTFHYLASNFKEDLLSRKSYAKKSASYPFYILFGNDDMKNPIKVCWLRMGSRVDAAVITEYENPLLGKKPAIPQETIIYIAVKTLDEAHYLCAILNSELFTKFVGMFSLKGGKGFASTNILKYIYVPKFAPDNEVHRKLASLSKQAHKNIYEGLQIRPVEEKINQLVKKLFLAEFNHDNLAILEKL